MADKIIYICGEFSSNRVEDINAKHLILGSLATMFSVRTHPFVQSIDAGLDRTEVFNTITRSHVFVFIFSKETVDDTFYLNQYGIAKAYGIPVIGVREPSYFMPNPLPEQFYFTEIVDYTGEIRDGKSNRGIPGPRKQFLLADALVQDFKSAMVYATEFYKSCFKRLLHKVSQAFNRTENEKNFYATLKDQPEIRPFKTIANAETQKNMLPKCPKCGYCFNKKLIKTPPLQRASSTGSLLRNGDAFEGESAAAQKLLFQVKKPTLHPTAIVIPCPPYSIKTYEPAKPTRIPLSCSATNRNQGQKTIEPFKGNLQSRSSMLQAVLNETIDKKLEDSNNKVVSNGETKEKGGENNDPNAKETRMLRKQSRVSNASWADKLKLKLRRQSSLPVIPTTYLVTSPAGTDKQLSFVKYPPDRFLLSPRQSLLPIFSEDEEQETIHISRAPSPDGSSWSEKDKEKEKEI